MACLSGQRWQQEPSPCCRDAGADGLYAARSYSSIKAHCGGSQHTVLTDRLYPIMQVYRIWNWRVPEPGQLPMPVLLHPVETDSSMAFPVRPCLVEILSDPARGSLQSSQPLCARLDVGFALYSVW